ncbi:NADPH-dependent F420 reductase [Kibdelosporangium aridum]|uniref:Pyrroline-5-carboxylate reductase catalytic N-terminal domain-containing protein n=1 Tax=Kibdelosporangium aridum TaxID=2030 RepID=A0A1Y5Y730_KIBAR|nr:NAD(P)-binding domain-containing protein [Kibdelosporangium aridum]SMD26603.1 hypothetical protein SAMN05661093_10186 [Kibdelosporangium aridum]
MRIAIIGAGNVGGALSAAAVKAGHQVTVTAKNVDHAAKVAADTGATAAESNEKAAESADVVVLAIPGDVVPEVAAQLKDTVAGKVVVDATNPLNATFSDLVIEGVSGGSDLQSRIPQARVVKAFNTILAARHATPQENGVPLDAYFAGDDAQAKATVEELVRSLGYRPVDAGGLRLARALEEMALLNIVLNAGNGWVWQSAWQLVGPTDAAQ